MNSNTMEVLEAAPGLKGAIKHMVMDGEWMFRHWFLPDWGDENEWYCAYVVIPAEHKERLGLTPGADPETWAASAFEEVCHGGCTFACIGFEPTIEGLKDHVGPEDLVIGWDYHHTGDTIEEFDRQRVMKDLEAVGGYIRRMIEEGAT